MVKEIEALYDGTVFRPLVQINLQPNTRVRILVEFQVAGESEASFLDTALALNLEGPADWSLKVEDYLYGQPKPNGV